MLFVIDVGNTQTSLGVYGAEDAQGSSSEASFQEASFQEASFQEAPSRLTAAWRISTVKRETADDIRSKLEPLFSMANIKFSAISEAAICSVVPALSVQWCNLLREHFGIEPHICNAQTASQAGLFEYDYPRPTEIGADRVADAIAARVLFGAPVVVVDFGTATNIEVIDVNGSFVGGIIAPGVETSAAALFQNATRLAATELATPPQTIGRNTEQAIQSGIVLGEAGRVDALVRRACEEIGVANSKRGGTCKVVATGGLASLVAQHSDEITDVAPELTLDGLRLLAQSCRQSDKSKTCAEMH